MRVSAAVAASIAAVVLLLLSAGIAAAATPQQHATPQQQQYENPAGQVINPSGQVKPASRVVHHVTPQPAVSGGLPFTGTDLGLAIVLGIALLGSGIGVRRVARRRAG